MHLLKLHKDRSSWEQITTIRVDNIK